MAKMTEDELKALTDAEMRQSTGYWGGKLAEQRRKAEYYYLGLPKDELQPPEVEGRSKVVSPDVRNTIEAMLPQLMVKFTGGDTVVDFEPQKQEDEETAKQVTDYINYLFFKKNNGHTITYTMFKDALLQKRGMVKIWWDTRVEETKEEYRALSDIELAQILEDGEVEPVTHSTYPDEDDIKQRHQAIEQLTAQLQQAMQAAQQNPQAAQAAQQIQAQIAQIQAAPPVMLHDLEVKRSKTGGKIAVENVPPEEFLISRKAKDIANASFVGHRVSRTVSELRSMGYKNIDDISSDDSAATLNAEHIERVTWDDERGGMGSDSTSTDESQKIIWLTECYMRVDFDGDGIAELRKVVRAGNQILENEVVDVIPFCSVCPVPLPHRFFGLSIADLAFEAQLTKTSILRAQLDNMYLQVNGRYFAVEGQVNLDDLLTSRPGGIVRMKSPNMAGRLDQGTMDGSGQMMMEYMENFLQESTGWTRNSQGNSAGDLQGTATGMNIVTNKDDMRLDLIARNFAEGFCEIFRMMLKLVCQHQHEAAEIKLNGAWLNIDPREWRNQFDVTINVGLGVGNKDQRIQHLLALRQQQDITYPLGVTTAENIYNANKELSKELGFKSPDKFFTDPVKNPPPQKPDPEQMKAQAQLPLIQAKAQADMQLKQVDVQAQAQATQFQTQAEMGLERDRMTMQAQVDTNRQAVEAEQQNAKMEKEAQLAQYMAGLDAQKSAAQMLHDHETLALQQAHERTMKTMDIDAADRKAQLAAQVSAHATDTAAKTSMDTAHMSAQASEKQSQSAQSHDMDKIKAAKTPAKPDTALMDSLAKLQSDISAIKTQKPAERKPASLVRGKDGKATHVNSGGELIPIKRDTAGRVEGI